MGHKLETVIICHPSNPAIPLRINKSDLTSDMVVFSDVATITEPLLIDDPILENGKYNWESIYELDGWRGLKEYSESIGFVKPDNVSWADCIPLIQKWEENRA